MPFGQSVVASWAVARVEPRVMSAAARMGVRLMGMVIKLMESWWGLMESL